jgi:hypothetical protein
MPRPHELHHAPAWLINVYTSFIKKASPEDQYVALSYVWEDPSLRDSYIMLQKDNLEMYQKLDAFRHEKSRIPVTILEAMTLTAALGQ